MSSEPYLVAHLVRGEPAFDIAIKLAIGDEEGWIIPTSGHRAYPYWDISLFSIGKGALIDGFTEGTMDMGTHYIGVLPDHYASDLSRDQSRRDAYSAHSPDPSFALSLGLVRPRTPIPRRV